MRKSASKKIDVYNLANNCKKKGIDILGTGDCLHSSWLSELKRELFEYSPGFFYTPLVQNVYLVLQTEIEAIWKQNNKVNKVWRANGKLNLQDFTLSNHLLTLHLHSSQYSFFL